ncbi:MAG: polyprenyl synthetase family protein [Oscillospiraceae bacterium]
MNDINTARLTEYSEMTNKRLLEYKERYGGKQTDYQHEVTEAMWYSLMSGGKRLRPALVLEFTRICGGDVQTALAAACALEMIHTFSLIHDDLPCMDNDDIRRGKPSCHKAYGEAMALLAGDALENIAFGVIADDDKLSDEKKVKLISELSRAVGTDGMIGGQVIDMDNVNGAVFPEDKLLDMYSMKTSALIRCACRMGVICAGRYELLDAAGEFGRQLGLAFQITDDILDMTSTTEQLGKPVGSDKELGKSTYAAVMGIEKAERTAAEFTERAEKALGDLSDTDFLAELTVYLLCRNK